MVILAKKGTLTQLPSCQGSPLFMDCPPSGFSVAIYGLGASFWSTLHMAVTCKSPYDAKQTSGDPLTSGSHNYGYLVSISIGSALHMTNGDHPYGKSLLGLCNLTFLYVYRIDTGFSSRLANIRTSRMINRCGHGLGNGALASRRGGESEACVAIMVFMGTHKISLFHLTNART